MVAVVTPRRPPPPGLARRRRSWWLETEPRHTVCLEAPRPAAAEGRRRAPPVGWRGEEAVHFSVGQVAQAPRCPNSTWVSLGRVASQAITLALPVESLYFPVLDRKSFGVQFHSQITILRPDTVQPAARVLSVEDGGGTGSGSNGPGSSALDCQRGLTGGR